MKTRDMVLAALFAALACVAAIIVRFGGAAMVPFSLLPLVVFLAGSLLGARTGAMSMVVYILLGLTGLPVFAAAPFGGFTYVLKPTFGFLLGFAGGAYITGAMLRQNAQQSFLRIILAMLAGLVVIYLVGLPYLYAMVNFYLGKAMPPAQVIKVAFIPYIGFDLIKLGIAAVIAKGVGNRLASARKEGGL
ncbi:MAG: biotin transporter BioY [Clostridia bacterium]|nr:biotin transporter BioY [Clostridia bacterium]